MLIYIIENLINGKIYIGQTVQTIGIRFSGNKRDCKCNNYFSYLHNAMNKYGIDNFKISIIEDSIETIEDLNEAEIYWIRWYDSTNREKGYNISLGGYGKGKCSEETKKKIGIANSLNKTPEARALISFYHKGKFVSDESRKKMSEAQKNISNDTRLKKSISMTGKHWKLIEGKRVWN